MIAVLPPLRHRLGGPDNLAHPSSGVAGRRPPPIAGPLPSVAELTSLFLWAAQLPAPYDLDAFVAEAGLWSPRLPLATVMDAYWHFLLGVERPRAVLVPPPRDIPAPNVVGVLDPALKIKRWFEEMASTEVQIADEMSLNPSAEEKSQNEKTTKVTPDPKTGNKLDMWEATHSTQWWVKDLNLNENDRKTFSLVNG